MSSYRKIHTSQLGGVLVEAAICLPILLLLCMGAVNIAYILDTHQKAKMLEYKALRASSSQPGLSGKPHENPLIAKKLERLMEGQGTSTAAWGIDSQYTGVDDTNLISFNVQLHSTNPLDFFGLSRHILSETSGQSAYLFRGSFSYDYASYDAKDWPDYHGWDYGGGEDAHIDVAEIWQKLYNEVAEIETQAADDKKGRPRG